MDLVMARVTLWNQGGVAAFKGTLLHLSWVWEFKEAIGSTAKVTIVKEFYRTNFEPLKEKFAFHRKMSICAFDINSNSAHEGTKNGMKFNSAAVRPQHTLHQAVGALLFQARTKAIDTQIKNSTKENSKGLWSSLPTALNLATLSKSLVAMEWMQTRDYSVVGPFADKWY
jgi:hypothetical protein